MDIFGELDKDNKSAKNKAKLYKCNLISFLLITNKIVIPARI